MGRRNRSGRGGVRREPDPIHGVADTGSAVYVGGHFQWRDNPDGCASNGIGAVDPATGLALDWASSSVPGSGARALLPDPAGLWIGDDAKIFQRQPRRGLQFAPLP